MTTVANVPDFRLTMAGHDLRGTIFDETAKLLDITTKVRPRLVSLTLSEKRDDAADQLDLVLDDTDGKLDLPTIGAVLALSLGWKQGSDVTSGLIAKGAFKVDEVSHSGPPDQVTIRARSADFTGTLKQRREHSYHATTLGGIISEVAARYKLKARCSAALAGIALEHHHQSRESDMAYLRRLGREHDAIATVKNGVLILAPKAVGTTASGKVLPHVTITRRQNDTHTFTLKEREQVEGVRVGWHDRKGAKRQYVTAGKEDGAKHLSHTYATEGEARRAAKAALARAGREPRTLELSLALGRADLAPEQRVTTSGFKAAIDATAWLVTEVSQTLSGAGFRTALKLEAA